MRDAALGDLAPVVVDRILVATPAAGAEWSVTLPGNQIWEVRSITATLVTSAAVATRRPSLVIDDQTTTFMRLVSGITSAASLTTVWSWVNGYDLETGASGSAVTDPFPADLTLPAGHRIRSVTAAIDVADQWSSIVVWGRRINTGVTEIAVAREAAAELYASPL